MKSQMQAVRPPLHLIQKFTGLDVLVIGEAMLDSYLEGSSDRLCREAPVPVVDIADRKNAPGGAANTAVNVQALGARAHLFSVIGDDAEGEMLRAALGESGVSADSLLVHSRRRTVAKQRVIAYSHMLLRFDQGTIDPLDDETEQQLMGCLEDLLPEMDAVIVSDYGYGILTPSVIELIADYQAQSPRILVADSKYLPAYRRAQLTAVKPNYDEVAQLLGLHHDGRMPRADVLMEHGERVLDMTGARIAAVTLDTEGAVIFERGGLPYRTYAHPTTNARAAGAGDTFVSALTLALAAGSDAAGAAELASAAAAIVVSKDGTSSCSALELGEYMSAGLKYVSDRSRLADRLEAHRQQGQRVVFTNGCFDILHSGHIAYLNRAKARGDILVVGVNSDESVRRLKGSGRPINSIGDRIQVLGALSCIDYLVPFEEDTPVDLIRDIKPNLFVKGGDYTRETLPEARIVEELGGSVEILPYLENHSTTSIVERIRNEKAGATPRPKTINDDAAGEQNSEQEFSGASAHAPANGRLHDRRLRMEQRRKRALH